MGGDTDANLAHNCLQKLHILPSRIVSMPREERAFLYASMEIRAETEKKEKQDTENRIKGR